MSADLTRLTNRERQVASLVRDGLTDHQVAESLRIKPRTAEWHVEQILAKLGIRSRSQIAVAVALAEAREPPAAPERPHGLPFQLSSFIGRQSDLDELLKLLETCRLLTLIGPPGVGKTRLAVELTSRPVPQFPGGVWFVDLAAVHQGPLVPRAVAAVLRVTEQSRQPLTQTLVDVLRNQRLLLLLDNCEHVVGAVAALAELVLGSGEGPTLLATSREPLRIAGEMAWRVSPLALPHQRGLDISELEGVEAIGLFVDRAQHASAGFRLTAENADAITQLCMRLDGIPLAIELAAVRCELMSPAEMLERMGDRFQLLRAGHRTASPRQSTMEAAIDWSHQLLSAEEAALFRRLSVFAGSFSLPAAEAVGAVGPLAQPVLALLASLVDKSLVVPAGQPAGHTRYRLLDTLRQYGSQRLGAARETAQARRAQLLHLAELAETISPQLYTDHLDLLEHLDLERDNFRAILSEPNPGDDDLAVRLVVALGFYWNSRGHVAEGRDALIGGLATEAGDRATRALGFGLAGQLAWCTGDRELTRSCAEQAIHLGRGIEPGPGLTIGLWASGMESLNALAFDAAACQFEESKSVAQQTGAGYLVFYALTGLYTIEMMTGRHSRARILVEETLTTFQAERFPLLHCIQRCIAGLLECTASDIARAKAHLAVGLRLARRWGVNYWGGWGVRAASYVATADGRHDLCWQLYGASQVLRDDTNVVVRGAAVRADDLLDEARSSMPRDAVSALIESGRKMSATAAFDLALALLDE
jgi:predicted ATPase/DNA-binding CsgD family transcriptional regulator